MTVQGQAGVRPRGRFGVYGGRYVPETLIPALEELEAAYEAARRDPAFEAEVTRCLRTLCGRPTPLYPARRLTEALGGARVYLKREDLLHTGAHKIDPGMRTPPAGTVPTNWVPFPQAWDTANLDSIRNPLPVNAQVLATGRKLFNTYCIVCHGAHADGLGYVVPKMTQPPPLTAGAALTFSDGRIFSIITGGLGNMPPYQTELDPSARWAIVHYVRVLQRAANPSPADMAYAQEANGMNFANDYPPAMTPNGPEPGTEAIPHN